MEFVIYPWLWVILEFKKIPREFKAAHHFTFSGPVILWVFVLVFETRKGKKYRGNKNREVSEGGFDHGDYRHHQQHRMAMIRLTDQKKASPKNTGNVYVALFGSQSRHFAARNVGSGRRKCRIQLTKQKYLRGPYFSQKRIERDDYHVT